MSEPTPEEIARVAAWQRQKQAERDAAWRRESERKAREYRESVGKTVLGHRLVTVEGSHFASPHEVNVDDPTLLLTFDNGATIRIKHDTYGGDCSFDAFFKGPEPSDD